MSLLYSTVLNVGSRPALTALVLVAGVAEAATQHLEIAPTVGAGPRGGPIVIAGRANEPSKATVELHVAAMAKPRDVRRIVVSRIPVDVVTLGGLPPAALAISQSVGPLGSCAFGLGSCAVALPRWVIRSTERPLSAKVTAHRARRSLPTLILVARATEGPALTRGRAAAVCTKSHATNVTPNVPPGQSCHLVIQAKVIPERPYLWPHAPWFRPYVAGLYAWTYLSLEITRAQAEQDIDYWLAAGQPWLYEVAP